MSHNKLIQKNCGRFNDVKKNNISKQLPNGRILLSKLTIRHDHGKANLAIRNVNKYLENLELECIDNNNINAEYLGQKGSKKVKVDWL